MLQGDTMSFDVKPLGTVFSKPTLPQTLQEVAGASCGDKEQHLASCHQHAAKHGLALLVCGLLARRPGRCAGTHVEAVRGKYTIFDPGVGE